MAEPFLGQITMFAGNFAPRGWAFCHGQLLPINQNQALFSILGTTYGGDGRTSFALPDLRGRAPVGSGRGPGLTARELGGKGGSETTALVQKRGAAGKGAEAAGALRFDNMQPYQTVNFIIALQGIFPSRT